MTADDMQVRTTYSSGIVRLPLLHGPEVDGPTHDVYWGSHGCDLPPDHDGPCICGCCECEDHARDHEANGCVARPPYYGPETNFYGDDVVDGVPYEGKS